MTQPYRAATAQELEILAAPNALNSIKELADAIDNISLTPGPKGDTGVQGPKGDTGVQGPKGDTGVQGPKGDTGAAGTNGTSPTLTSITTDILPSQDNQHTLGNSQKRWKSISIGEGTIYITDATLGTEVGLTINNGIFFIDGIAQAQLPNVKVTNLIFNDNTVQTTAPGVPVPYNPTWSGTGLAFTGTPATGSYMKVGKLVTFRAKVVCTTVTNFGTGQYSITLPFSVASNYQFNDGAIHRSSNGNHYPLKGHIDNSNILTLWDGAGATDIVFDHNSPYTLTTSDYFYITGTYESV